MSKNSLNDMFNTKTQFFVDILGGNINYIIPKYQRDYSWDYDEWQELYDDIFYAINNDIKHYMGYIVLEPINNTHYLVIDGQQRLTTLSILVLALVYIIKSKDNSKNGKERVDNILQKYIGEKDLLTLVSNNKLVLNRNCDNFYKKYLSTYEKYHLNDLNHTEKLMANCFDFFCKNFNEKFGNSDISIIIEFLKKLDYTLFFTVMVVDDDVNAYSVFETLNARGVELSTTDLLKNYLYSQIDDGDMDKQKLNEMDEIWSDIVSLLKDMQFSDFLYIYWNGKYEYKNKKEIFKALKNEINSKNKVFPFLRDVKYKVITYNLLFDYNNVAWKGKNDISEYLELLHILKLDQPYSLLIYAYEIINNENDFKKILKYIVFTSFRYNTICRRDPKKQSRLYNRFSRDMIINNKFDFDGFKKGIYISDEEFVAEFSYKSFFNSSNKVVKYILEKISKFDNNIISDDCTIEHIMPKSYNNIWNISKNDVEEYAFRLGNMILLEKNINKECDSLLFEEKKVLYKKSKFDEAKKIGNSENIEWTFDDITKRQKMLANKAKSIWSI